MEKNTVEEMLCTLMDFNLSNFDKTRNDLLKMLVGVFKSNQTNNEKIFFIKKLVNVMVKNFFEAIARDCVPQKDVEQVFGIKGDTEIISMNSVPVERAIVGVWEGLYREEIIKQSQIEEALLKGILPKIFKVAVDKYIRENEINSYFKAVKENMSKIPWDSDIHTMINKISSIQKTDVKQFHEKIDQGMIKVNFGFDKIHGFFFYVTDERLGYEENASEEFNKVCEKADMIGCGDGTYISIYTGENGFGEKVSLQTMKTFWKKYGVGKKFLDDLN